MDLFLLVRMGLIHMLTFYLKSNGFNIVCPSKAPVIKSVVWSPPAPGRIKVNTDGAAIGSPGVGGCGGIFRNCRAFVKGCFAIPLGQVFTFEAKLLAASLAINFP